MKKALVIISLLALMVVPLIGLTACGQSLSENDLATIRGFASRMDNAEAAIADLKAKVASINTDVTKADLDKTTADITALKSDNAALITKVASLETDNATLKADIAALKAGNSSTTPSSSTGQVTANIIDKTPLLVYSTSAGMQYNFRVRIVNSTTSYQYVGYSLILALVNTTSPITVDTTATALTTFGGFGVTYTTLAIPSNPPATQILFAPSGKIPVAAGGAVEISHLLVVATSSGNAQWEGNLTGVIVSTTW